MKASLLCGLAAAVLLTACDKPAEQPASVPVAPATEANLPADAPKAAKAWSASSVGVGPITATTPFRLETIAALFPGAEVETIYLTLEGVQVPFIIVLRPGEDLRLEIREGASPGRIGEIVAVGDAVVGPRGEVQGDDWRTLGFKASECVIGAGRYAGSALCRRPDAPALAYVIRSYVELTGRPGEAPDQAVLTAHGFFREFLWQTPKA